MVLPKVSSLQPLDVFHQSIGHRTNSQSPLGRQGSGFYFIITVTIVATSILVSIVVTNVAVVTLTVVTVGWGSPTIPGG